MKAQCRYLSIVKEEGLEISQPALDPNKSEIHHQITERDRKSKVHRSAVSVNIMIEKNKKSTVTVTVFEFAMTHNS